MFRNIYGLGNQDEENDTYVKPDDDGVFRLTTAKTWKVTYVPTGSRVGKAFRLPVLAPDIEGEIIAERYDDMDIVPVTTATTLVHPTGGPGALIIVIGLVVAAGIAGVVATIRKRAHAGDTDDTFPIRLPKRVTPLTAVVTLQRIDREYGSDMTDDDRTRLRQEIAELEHTYFATDAMPDASVGQLLERWIGSAQESQSLA